MAINDTVTKQILKALSEIDNRKLLASHLPVGRVWGKAFDWNSNLGALVAGLAVEYYRLGVLVEKVSTELDIDQTNELLVEWEKSVGIPNDYFSITNISLEDRRKNLKMLFTNFGGVQTLDDFYRIAEYYEYDVTITPGVYSGSFPLAFPFSLYSSTKEVKFTIFIQLNNIAGYSFFPLIFPIPFSPSGGSTFLKTIFELLAPANVQILVSEPIIEIAGSPYTFQDIGSNSYIFSDIGSEFSFTDIFVL